MSKTKQQVYLYTVYNKKSDVIVAENETAKECAKKMGICVEGVYRLSKEENSRWLVLAGGKYKIPQKIEPEPKTIGQYMRKCRKDRGYTHEQMSKETGIQTTCISRYENDIMVPRLWNLITIADFLNVSIDELIGRKLMFEKGDKE